MTIQDLGNIGEFIASIGVIASLIYLAVQVRQNTGQIEQSVRSVEMEAYQNLIGRISDYNLAVIGDASLAALLIKVREEPQSMGPDELQRYSTLLMLMFRQADMAYFQYQQGFVSEERMLSAMGLLISQLLVTPRGRELWHLRRGLFVQDFRDYLDALIEKLPVGPAGPMTGSIDIHDLM